MNVFEHGADLLICKAGRGWTFTISQKKVGSKNGYKEQSFWKWGLDSFLEKEG